MFDRYMITGMLFSGSLAFAAPLLAQTAVFDTSAITTGCAESAGACDAAVAATVSGLSAAGLSEAELNTQLGIIASIVVTQAASLPPAQLPAIADVLSTVAAVSTNPAQRTAITQVTSSLQTGASVDLDAAASSLSDS